MEDNIIASVCKPYHGSIKQSGPGKNFEVSFRRGEETITRTFPAGFDCQKWLVNMHQESKHDGPAVVAKLRNSCFAVCRTPEHPFFWCV